MINTDHLEGVSHLGWTLDITDDGTAIFYRAERGSESVLLDWSSHRRFEPAHFAKMVELAFPTRTAGGGVAPLSPEDVDQLHADTAALTEFQRDADGRLAA